MRRGEKTFIVPKYFSVQFVYYNEKEHNVTEYEYKVE